MLANGIWPKKNSSPRKRIYIRLKSILISATQSTQRYQFAYLHENKILNIVILLLGISCATSHASSEQDYFNIALQKRPQIWPPNSVCGQSRRTEFCRTSSNSSSQVTCLNSSFCDLACPSSFYYLAALNQPDIVINALRDSRASGWSSCVLKDRSFLCPSASAGNFSVRFLRPSVEANANCSLVLERSWLAPFIISDTWNVTLSTWIYSEMQNDTVGTLVEINGGSSFPGPLLRITLNSTSIKIQSGSSVWEALSWQVPLHQWTHLAFVVFEDYISILVNGSVLNPGAFGLKLLPHNRMNDFRLGQSLSRQDQFIGYLQNFQIFYGALSNREVRFLYDGVTDNGFLVQPACTCPSKYPAEVANDTQQCQQNPGSPIPAETVPRLNPIAHPLEYVTDGNMDTFWVSEVNGTTETNSVVIDFGSIFQVMFMDLFFFSPFPLATVVARKRSPMLPWEPWLSFKRNCSNSSKGIPCVTITGHPLTSGHLTFDLSDGQPAGDQLPDFTLASAVNISMTGFPVSLQLLRYHAIYEVTINASCYCNDPDSYCDRNLQTCICGADSLTTGPNCLQCVSGFYRNSSAVDNKVCQKCDCDLRGTVNGSDCALSDGQCVCKANVKGHQCNVCADGYYNLTVSNDDGCQPCLCQLNNTVTCDDDTGECSCQQNVKGTTCDRCHEKTFWSETGEGCDDCGCFPSGAINQNLSCDVNTGQCLCKASVSGRTCNQCKPGFYGLSDDLPDGCLPCNCSSSGTVERVACDVITGQCACRPAEGDVSLGGRKCDPYVSQFFPTFGPESGGTAINIAVGFLGNIRSVSIYIGSVSCIINYNISSSTNVVCVTASIRNASELLNKSLGLTIHFSSGQQLTTVDRFTYKPDPVIEKVWPLRTIESGGINLTIFGSSLSSVAFPYLRVMRSQLLEDGTQKVTLFISPCYHVAETLICPTPRLSLPEETRKKRRLLKRTIHHADEDPENGTRSDLRFYIGFVLDGLEKFYNLSETLPQYGLLDVYQNPTVYDFTETDRVKTFNKMLPRNESTIAIKGNNLDLGAGRDDYIISIGRAPCVVVQLTCNQILCIPPDSQPKPENEIFSLRGLPAVKVAVGNILVVPGYLEYVAGETVMNDATVRYSIIAAVILAVIIIIVVVLCVVFVRRRRRPKHFHNLSISKDDIYCPTNLYFQPKNTLRSRSIYLTPINSAMEAFLCKLSDDLRLKIEDCLLEDETLVLMEMIGQGHFGQVFVGELSGNDNAPLRVAVKTLRDLHHDDYPQDVADFLEEATLMYHLQHEHILSLIGIILKPSPTVGICVVLPYMANGDLRSFISSEANVLTVKALTEFGLQVTDGMKYLELNKFVHRDLACRNCMVSADFLVKVADFGLSRDIYEKDYYRASCSKRPLPIKWMAIESLDAGVFTTKSDVWSFGVLLWELMTRGSIPYPDIDHMDIKSYLKTGKRLSRPAYAPDEIYVIMMECWEEKTEKRPSFDDIEKRIADFLQVSTKLKDHMREGRAEEIQEMNQNGIYVEIAEPSDSETCNQDSISKLNHSSSETVKNIFKITCDQTPNPGLQPQCHESIDVAHLDNALQNFSAATTHSQNVGSFEPNSKVVFNDADLLSVDDATFDYTRL